MYDYGYVLVIGIVVFVYLLWICVWYESIWCDLILICTMWVLMIIWWRLLTWMRLSSLNMLMYWIIRFVVSRRVYQACVGFMSHLETKPYKVGAISDINRCTWPLGVLVQALTYHNRINIVKSSAELKLFTEHIIVFKNNLI